MAEDVLSTAELELLLSSLESDDSPLAKPPAAAPAAQRPAASPKPAPVAIEKPAERVTTYDFKRPQPARNESLAALELLHQPLARRWAQSLAVLLRTSVDVRLAPLEQPTYGEFAASLESPTCLHVLQAAGLEGPLFLDLSPALVFPMIDRLLGGVGDPTPMAGRPLTDIEMRLSSRVTGLFLEALAATWREVLPVELKVERFASNPAVVTIVPPTELVVLVKLDVAIGKARGSAKLAIVRRVWEELGRKTGNQNGTAAGRPATLVESQPVVENLQQAPLELVARLAETKITSAELFNLRVGDIITTDKSVRGPITVCVEGVPKFRAHVGAFQGRKAIRIEQA